MSDKKIEFHKLTLKERISYVKKLANLTNEEVKGLSTQALELDSANRMIENVIGVIPIPLGIASGFIINDMEYLVPMATEQRSIVLMTMRGAELTRDTGGFIAETSGSRMIGQIQVMKVKDFEMAKQRILANVEKILQRANTQSRTRRALDVEVRKLDTSIGDMVIVELTVDVKDSMGANVVNSMCEAISPLIESLTEGKANLRAVSNLATQRLVHVETVVAKDTIGGEEIVDRVVMASEFARADPFRAATNNKGIMNSVSAVLLATNNDMRAVEAGAHAYAARMGHYHPLSTWHQGNKGHLHGRLVMPMAVGIVGGAISSHPTARTALKISEVKTATELGEVAASAGLAYNLSALLALVTGGIQSFDTTS